MEDPQTGGRAVSQQITITLRQLRAFSEAYRLRNLTHAAESLHMTQSAMSSLIRQFEESLGLPMFERTPRALRPTKAADEFIHQTEDILNRMAALQASARNKAREGESVLSFTCVPALASAVVPDVLAEFGRRMPHVRTVMFDEGDATLIDRVLSQECEFSVSSFAHDPETISQMSLVTDSVVAVCSKSSPLASMPEVRWADLAGHPLIHLPKLVTLQPLLDECLPPSPPGSAPACEIGFIHTALALAAKGLGVVILPKFLVKGNPHAGALVAKTLHDPVAEHHLRINTRVGHTLSAPASLFLDLLRDRLNAIELG
jgi:DNA-binding transcriptional LysR family regulator